MSDEESTPRRSYVWKLNKAECERELRRSEITWEPNTTVISMRRMLSTYLKGRQSSSQPNLSSSQPNLRSSQPDLSYSQPNISADNRINVEIHRANEDPDEIRSFRSAHGSPPRRGEHTQLILDTIREEILKIKEQIMDDLHEQLQITERKPTQPAYAETKREIKPPIRYQHNLGEDISASNQVRRWDATFDGEKSVLTFLERIEEMRMSIHIPDHQLLECIPILLKGKALQWHRNNRKNWQRWDEFTRDLKEFFLPGDIEMQIEEEIKARTQGAKECAKDFIIAIQTLMRRLGTMSERRQVDRIHLNLRPEYQRYIRRHEVTTINDVIRLADDYERLLAKEKAFKAPPAASQALMPETAYGRTRGGPENTVNAINTPYNRGECCWRCGQRGHSRQECKNTAKLFCSWCGRKGVYSRECPCPKPDYAFRMQTTANPNPTTPTNWVTAPAFTPVIEPQPSTSRQNLNTINGRPPQDSRPFVKVQIGSKMYHGLIDSGAISSFMSKEPLHEIRAKNLAGIAESNLKVSVADGRRASIIGQVTCPVKIEGNDYQIKFHIIPGLNTPVLLGVDALRALNCRLDFRTMTSSINTLGEELEDMTEDQARGIIQEELKKFETINGPTTLTQHEIRVKPGQEPIKFRYSPRNPAMQQIIDDEVAKMLEAGVIEKSASPWSSPVVIVKKKNNKYRFCIDFRKINEVTERDAYPLPQVGATLDKLRNARFITTLDLKDGYWQIPLTDASKPVTAFTVPGRGLFQFKVLPFGLHSAPVTFQRLLDRIISPELEPRAFVYLDDIVVLGTTLKEHVETLTEVLRRLQEAKLRVNPDKCQILQKEIKYLGHVVNQLGIHTDPEKVRAIAEIKAPRDVKEMRRFLGMTSWYRRFIPSFATTTQALTKLLKKKQNWVWGSDQIQAFEKLKEQLTTAPILAPPDFEKPFTLQTDASNEGLGVVLTQTIDNREKVIAYASRTLNPAEKNYSTTEKECLAVVWGIQKMRMYLEGYRFLVITDHQSLKWLKNIQSPAGRIARWNLYLQQFDFEIQYRKGNQNVLADALSRSPLYTEAGDDADEEICTMMGPDPWYPTLKEKIQQEPENYPDYQIRNGKVFRHLFHRLDYANTEARWKLCLPREDRDRIFRENHDDPTAGHMGIAKTIARISQHYYWPGMNKDIAQYVRACRSCQQHKPAQLPTAGKMGTINAQQPWEYVAIDLVGPLPRSTQGYTYLCVIQDKFTKWVEIHPLRQPKSTGIIKALKERVIYRFGCPKTIISDNGSQFTSKEFTGLLSELGIQHQRTPPYSPQCNPVERANRVVKTMISQYITGQHKTWDRYLPELNFAINSARHESTKFSPAYLNYGREMSAPNTLHNANERTDRQTQLTRLQDTMEFVRTSLAKAFTHQKKYYDLRRRDWIPKVGDKVARKEHVLSSAADQFAAKLAPKYQGNLTVSRILGRVRAEVIDEGGRTYQVHVKDIRPWIDEELYENTAADELAGPVTRARAKAIAATD